MSSPTEICNLALTRIGVQPISLLTEASEAARKCNAIYHSIRRAVLRDHPWNFATKIKPLAESATDSVFGYSHIYVSEPDCIFPRRLFNEATAVDKKEEFIQIQSSIGEYLIIACHIKPAYLEYTADVQNTSLFDASFIDAFAWRIASDVAQKLTGSAKLTNDCQKAYLYALDRAKILNAAAQYKNTTTTSSYENARR